MSKYFLGVDIGGTKSHALLTDETGRLIGFAAGGPGNHEIVGYSGLVNVLAQIIQESLAQAGINISQLSGAGFGIAGYDWPGEREATLNAISQLKLSCPIEIVNDAVLGLIAGAPQGWGICVIAGTGENCWGRDQSGRIGRLTGDSHTMAEYGGASSIVRKAVQAVSLAWSSRGPKTALLDAFLVRTQTHSADELLEKLVLGSVHLGASDAPLVIEVAEAGDRVALDILRWAGQSLADLARGVIRQLDFQAISFDAVLAGSMFHSAPVLMEEFRRTILSHAPGIQFHVLGSDPVVGAALLGMEAAGCPAEAARKRMLEHFSQKE